MPLRRMAEIGVIPESGGEGDLGERVEGQVRRRADRRDREGDPARRDRLPDPPRRIHRPRRALRPSGAHELGRARHLPRRAARPRERHPHRRRRRAACGAQAPRLRAQDDADRSAARTESTPSRRPSASSSPSPMPSSPAPGPGSSRRARRSRLARSPARSARSPTSTRRVEAYVAAKLGLRPEPISTQVIPRDRHAAFFATLGVVASSVERLATEIRHLQRTEVMEAEEFFSEGQKGSSAMPHKRNPVLAENLTGLARMVRSAVIAGARGRGALARARHLAFLGRAHDRA